MSDHDEITPGPRSRGERVRDAVTVSGAKTWAPVALALFAAGGVYTTLKRDLADLGKDVTAIQESKKELGEKLEKANDAVKDAERRVDLLEAKTAPLAATLDRVLKGIEALDRKLYALACKGNPNECDRYVPALPQP